MLPDKVHVLIKGLNACHVGLCVIRKFNFMSSAYTLGAPVEISHIHGTSYLTGNCVEACLPALYRLACAFRSERQMHDRSLFISLITLSATLLPLFLSTGMPPSFRRSHPSGPQKSSPLIMQYGLPPTDT